MRIVETSDVRELNDANDSPKDAKRLRLDDDLTDVNDGNLRRRYIKQIHILAEILDALEVGGREPKMSMF